MPAAVNTHWARGGFSPTLSLRSSPTALTPCSCRSPFSNISVWMAANNAAAASRDDTDTVRV